ncbi:MAG: hypothetical protein NTW86_22860 [Candidatus Sumerlaeota bacterium]|nr:hypothetical protein [Candidatus Sumerlaeota bacterium]
MLDVNDGSKGFTIDWSGENPIYTCYDLANGAKKVTSVEWLENGTMNEK